MTGERAMRAGGDGDGGMKLEPVRGNWMGHVYECGPSSTDVIM